MAFYVRTKGLKKNLVSFYDFGQRQKEMEKKMKKIIVTGCNGQLGRALNQIYQGNAEYQLINTDVCDGDGITKLDITNVEAVIKMAKEEKPYAIVNCAAYTNVDKCETDIDLAYRINAIGPRNLSIAASETGAKMVQVSTDYVFPGNLDKALTEFDTPAPISMYGKTKFAGENFTKEFSQKHYIIRTAWLYGDGKNFVKTMLGLAEKNDSINVVKDQMGSPTSAIELAKAIQHLIPTDNYGLFHGTCEGSCAWSDFATEIFRLAGKKTKVHPITSQEYKELFPNSANRPAFSILENYMFKQTTSFQFAEWHEAIAQYMKELMG